jgi:hypothetical protein
MWAEDQQTSVLLHFDGSLCFGVPIWDDIDNPGLRLPAFLNAVKRVCPTWRLYRKIQFDSLWIV